MNKLILKLSILLIFLLSFFNGFNVAYAMPGAGNCLYFNGATQYVNATGFTSVGITKFSIDLWFKYDVATTEFLTAQQTECFEIHLNGDNYVRFIPTGGVYIDSDPNSITPGVWTHLAVVYDPTGAGFAAVYINGIQVNVQNNGPNPLTTPVNQTPTSFNLGIRLGSTYPYYGSMDEVRVWNKALSQTEIRTNMCKKLTGSESNLVAYWNFDQTSGTNLPDLTSNGYTGTLINSPTWVASGAALGNASAYNYSGDYSATISYPSYGDLLYAAPSSGSFSGMQVYRIDYQTDQTLRPTRYDRLADHYY